MAVRDSRTEWLLVKRYRTMTPQERLEAAAELFEGGVELVRASILHRHPDISPAELHWQIRRRVLPRGLAEKVRRAIGAQQ